VIKHDYLQCLAEGKKLCIQTTMDWSGQTQSYWSGIHDKAVWMRNKLAQYGNDLEALRKDIVENKIAFRNGARLDAKIDAIMTRAPETMVSVPKFIVVDGKKKELDTIPSGHYKVTKDGRLVDSIVTINKNANGFNRLLSYAKDACELATIRTFTR